jgi:hypothetical protein
MVEEHALPGHPPKRVLSQFTLHTQHGLWGYDLRVESPQSRPTSPDCPKAMLDLVAATNPRWRTSAAAYHAMRDRLAAQGIQPPLAGID